MKIDGLSGKEIDRLIDEIVDICLTKSLMDRRFSYLVYDLKEIKKYKTEDKKKMLKKFLEQNKFLYKELNIDGRDSG